jgi:hypothetical protein
MKIRKIMNVRRSGNSSHNRIPLLGLSSSKVDLYDVW